MKGWYYLILKINDDEGLKLGGKSEVLFLNDLIFSPE